MSVTIYHNPRCSKSRQTLALLEERGIAPTVVEYLKDAPDADALRTLLKMLGKRPREIIRRGEAVYKELGLGDTALDDDALIGLNGISTSQRRLLCSAGHDWDRWRGRGRRRIGLGGIVDGRR